MDDSDKINSSTWRVDDLDGGLSDVLSGLHGLGTHQELMDENVAQAYDMTQVLELQMFKEETLESSNLLQSLQESLNNTSLQNSYLHSQLDNSTPMDDMHHSPVSINHVSSFNDGKFIIRQMEEKPPEIEYLISLKAPTAPGLKLDEETLTWLNQGQPYEIVMKSNKKDKHTKGQLIKAVVSIGFQERQHQYFEFEKYDEWVLNRPNERMMELDVPMCLGVHNASHIGPYTNEIEFEWDPSDEARLFVKVNCLSSEFTKRMGESGVTLRLQIEVLPYLQETQSTYTAGCKVKVFRAKGANRKLKLGREKHENLSKEEAGQLQQSQDLTVFKKLEVTEKLRRKSSDNVTIKSELSMCGISPTQLSQLNIVNSNNSSISPSPGYISTHISQSPGYISTHNPGQSETNLSANCTVEETQSWLGYNRFHNYLMCFTNFTGADLLRLSRSDLIQLCGPADGIRLNNCLQARASRPLLTIYVSPEWHQSETGMREYHAMFLEQLTVEDLKRKLAKKCGIEDYQIVAILKQGPTGIHIHVDDEVVRNFVEEAHYVVEVIKDPMTGQSKILLK